MDVMEMIEEIKEYYYSSKRLITDIVAYHNELHGVNHEFENKILAIIDSFPTLKRFMVNRERVTEEELKLVHRESRYYHCMVYLEYKKLHNLV